MARAPSLLISSKERFRSFKLFTAPCKDFANAFAPSVFTRQSPKFITSMFFRFGSTCEINYLNDKCNQIWS